MLIASVLSSDPVLYIDDRWLYDKSEILAKPQVAEIKDFGPKLLASGEDITVVGSGYSTLLAENAIRTIESGSGTFDLIDVRVLTV